MTDGPDFPFDGPAGLDGPDLPSGGPDGPDDELPFDGLDAERPLPAELRARLEAALLAAMADGLPVAADAGSLDAPRPLPEALRARLEAALLAEAGTSPGPAPASEPAAATAPPAPVPVIPLERRRRKVVALWSSAAAVLLLVIAVAGLAGRGGDPGPDDLLAGGTTTSAPAPAPFPSGAEVGVEPSPAGEVVPGPDAPAATVTTRVNRPGPPTSTTAKPPAGGPVAQPAPEGPVTTTVPPASPGGGAGDPAGTPQPTRTDPGPPPPFYESASPVAASPPSMSSQPGGGAGAAPSGDSQESPSPQKSATPTGSALRVGIITGDAAQEAGFRAYVKRLNDSGGVRGHALELVPVSAGSPAADLVATVNLSPQPVAGPRGAPGWATGPLLETLTTPESLLAGNGAVFSFASPPERQGRLAADALFPSAVTDRPKAVIYAAASGPLADVVPEAMRAMLEQRGVNAVIRTYDPARSPNLDQGADAVLLSLDPAAARAWVAQARAAGHRPPRGVAGIYSLFDDTLAADLPDGTRVVSPYIVPAGAEGDAIRADAGGASAPVLHGWATAKALAAAVYRSGADTPAELQAALEGLAGWSSGLAPPYETRPNTRARTPEGALFRIEDGALNPEGGFRRDPS